ncbi:spore coat protein [Lysinibacillus yapensis]|uniref:Spore coat protein n=1 Tax=Ureibacillus yapensis TaxID=2304605 RepID=A0A396SIL0_9BACL|nr:spore coat protein [Lysinibacillus yapensis]RHW40138.1 spore coat protein [Lysinibacillus yapensis]
MKDYLDPHHSVGMPELTDAGVALELLLSLKTGVRTLSIALTETASPSLRKIIKTQLDAMIDLYSETSELMMKKEWLKPFDLDKQKELDIRSAQNAIDIAQLDLFPENMNRKGMFPTPPQK